MVLSVKFQVDFPPFFFFNSDVKIPSVASAANILARMEVIALLQPSDVFVQKDLQAIIVKFPQAKSFDNRIDCQGGYFCTNSYSDCSNNGNCNYATGHCICSGYYGLKCEIPSEKFFENSNPHQALLEFHVTMDYVKMEVPAHLPQRDACVQADGLETTVNIQLMDTPVHPHIVDAVTMVGATLPLVHALVKAIIMA